jgi:hypothetical protein
VTQFHITIKALISNGQIMGHMIGFDVTNFNALTFCLVEKKHHFNENH